jgi:hypothetical protein
MKRSKQDDAAALDAAARALFLKLGTMGSTLSGKNGHMLEERADEAFGVFYGKLEHLGCSGLGEVQFIKDLWDDRAEKLGTKLTGTQHRELQESIRVHQISARGTIDEEVVARGHHTSAEQALYACSSIVSAWAMDRAVQACREMGGSVKKVFTHRGNKCELSGRDLCTLSWLGAVTGRYTLAGGGVYLFSLHSTTLCIYLLKWVDMSF